MCQILSSSLGASNFFVYFILSGPFCVKVRLGLKPIFYPWLLFYLFSDISFILIIVFNLILILVHVQSFCFVWFLFLFCYLFIYLNHILFLFLNPFGPLGLSRTPSSQGQTKAHVPLTQFHTNQTLSPNSPLNQISKA